MGARVGDVLATTDHKVVGYLYLTTSFALFLVAGLMAMVMRGELLEPGLQVVSAERYDQLLTMHGTIMLLLFATPTFAGFANVLVPLQIGSPDVAFPRLNTLSYYLFLFGALLVVAGFAAPGGGAAFGWTGYAPLSSAAHSPGAGPDLWIMGLVLSGAGTILTSVNLVTTIAVMRAPGMIMFRMPIFTWNVLLTSLMVLLAFPVLTGALLALEADRKFGAHVYDAPHGGAILWQHLFWFFGHPEVYIVALPFFGIVTEVVPVFSRKPVFGYFGMVAATISITGLSMTVWAHHMFATGRVLLPFFSFMSFLIAVPTGVKFFNWIGTMWRGQIRLDTPMLFAVGFLVTFLFGGLTGVILASPPLDFDLTDTYFVVGHLHYVLFGTIVFATFAGFYFWWPKMTGRRLDETWGKVHFWTLFVGFQTTFLVQHVLGVQGMARRIADYPAHLGALNAVSSAGAFVLGASTFAFLWNIVRTHRRGERIEVADPWGGGNSLEWVTSCPPPRHNFHAMPAIRSNRPAFDLRYPPEAPPQDAEIATPRSRGGPDGEIHGGGAVNPGGAGNPGGVGESGGAG
ncbi:cytochrome c oxidase subunit I [Actinomadura logoneensis]|uniref:Cytochrome c oxidase subunit 1 n=1 Tax=Actinomadura logoneensis TaxID=2293572 RepID=A0A372JFK0_9ACTN|nr:cytochrome c oxidase subunit I [Actinomadura logoneensis]RFU38148.1 cytochrome c oxidase subunit I [Actinomadura logoneensis]